MATKRGCKRSGRKAPSKKGGKCGKKLKKCKCGRTKAGTCKKTIKCKRRKRYGR